MPGDKPTSFDIAALAGVSQPTVSRALRGDPTVKEATRLRVAAVAAQLNYKVDKHASSLRRGQSNTLALLFFEDPTPHRPVINPFFSSMLASILHACARQGYDLLTSFQQLSSNWHMDYEDSRKADGIILLGYGDYALFKEREAELQRQGTRYVRWGAPIDGDRGTIIGCDNLAGGRQAGEYLVARGRQRIAFVGDASDHYPEFRARYRGMAAVLTVAGLPVDPGLQVDSLSDDDDGYHATMRLMARGIAFDAIFAASDMIALGALRALGEAGRRVPDDVAVIGFDDIPAAALVRPALTTVAQDYALAGKTLVDLLIRRIDGGPTTIELLPPSLIVRQSA